MKIRYLVRHWEQNARGRMTKHHYSIPLDVETAARLAALHDMYPKRSVEEILGELVGSALEELEASFPYVQGQKVVAQDEQGDPIYEDIGPTPRFLQLSRKYLQELTEAEGQANHS
ncbi:pilin assembly protein [Pseudomonas sp. SCB32]|uniref:pilin assembly protein n=1 Tax=Pseudomonas sp. SCB32 TaxID=2653853 RepID=UPI001264C0E3|nr:pilin assembly protein [Pseudomonas sp. SCB32]